MKYLVTGGAGFIGSHIVEELVSMGEDVVVIDDLSEGKLENIEPWMDKIKFIKADIRDKDAVAEAMEGVDYVLHQAASRSVPHSLDHPLEYNDVNINGTVILLEAARKNKVKRFVFASSSSVYGDVDSLPMKEGDETFQISPYALTKFVGERYLKMYHYLYGLETVSLRYFNVFGPRQDPDSQYAVVIPLFIKWISNDENPIVFGDGEQSRDFTYVKNIVEGNLKACDADGVAGEAFNLANGDRITVNKLWKDINSILGKDVEPVYEDKRPGDVLHTQADNSKAKKLLGYEGSISFEEGLKKTVEWFKKEC